MEYRLEFLLKLKARLDTIMVPVFAEDINTTKDAFLYSEALSILNDEINIYKGEVYGSKSVLSG